MVAAPGRIEARTDKAGRALRLSRIAPTSRPPARSAPHSRPWLHQGVSSVPGGRRDPRPGDLERRAGL